MAEIERHPFEPFLPERAKILALGSFPPQEKRWSVPFYYPNFINDFWRVMGILFFRDKDHFVDKEAKKFKLSEIKEFCGAIGLAMYDTATAVRRLKDNASDKFLEVVEPTDVRALLARIPECEAIITTGQKATDTICATFNVPVPAMNGFATADFDGKVIRLYRLPSTSRAYPLALPKKAEAYGKVFKDLGIL